MVSISKITRIRPVKPKPDDLTGKVIKTLTPKIDNNRIDIKDCVIFGKKRSGKTYLEKAIAEKIVEHYGEDNVNVYMSDSISSLVSSLDTSTRRCSNCGRWILDKEKCRFCNEKLEILGKKKNVHVLIVDDPLKRYLSRGGTTGEQKEAIENFEAIAHKLENKLNTKKGVGIIIIGSQQYKGLEKTFRDAVVRIFKTTMGEDQPCLDRHVLLEHMHRKILYEITNDIYVEDKHERRDTSIALICDLHKGICVFPPYQKDYSVNVGSCIERWELKYKPKGELIADLAGEVKVSGYANASVSVVRAFLRDKHPDAMDEMQKIAPAVCDKLSLEKYNRKVGKKKPTGALHYGGYKPKNDDSTFVWEYKVEKPRVFAFLSNNTKKRDVPKMLRAYELVCLGSKSQKEAVKCMVKEGVVDKCTQASVSRWCKSVEGSVDCLRGLKYESYVRERLKDDTVKNLFDRCGIKKVYHSGKRENKNYPDLLIAYDDGDIDVVSCKCFSKKNYRTNVMAQQNCDVSPEVDTFTKLKRGNEVALPDRTTVKSNPQNAVRLVFLMNCMNKETPCEVYKIYEQVEELPRVLNFSQRGLERGVFKKVAWSKNVKKPKKEFAVKSKKKANIPQKEVSAKPKTPLLSGVEKNRKKHEEQKDPKKRLELEREKIAGYYTGKAKKERTW